MEKIVARGLLASYVLILIWLVLFKLQVNISSLVDQPHRSLNLIPFAAPLRINGRVNYGEMILNCLVFIPFGLLLSVNIKKVGFLPKLVFILGFSFMAELLQYIFSIGATDITDLLTNTTGGFLGLIVYEGSRKFIHEKKVDRFIIVAGLLFLLLFLVIRSRLRFI